MIRVVHVKLANGRSEEFNARTSPWRWVTSLLPRPKRGRSWEKFSLRLTKRKSALS